MANPTEHQKRIRQALHDQLVKKLHRQAEAVEITTQQIEDLRVLLSKGNT